MTDGTIHEELLVEVPAGSSLEQREAEGIVLKLLIDRLGFLLRPERIHLPSGAFVDVDGVSHDPPALVEAWAHQGPPKSAQKQKVLADALKLNYVADVLGAGHRKILCFSDDEAAAPFTGRSWYAGALAHAGIEIQIVELPPEWRQRIRDAQTRQYR
jgi:hypothetical protein